MNTRQSMMMAAALMTAVGLAACATPPQRNDQLEQARMAVQSLEQDPDAQIAAAADLHDARNNLQNADAAFERHESPEHVTYLAYLADREAQTGEEHASAYRANQEIARGNEERNRIVLESRNQEVQQAREAEASQAEQTQLARQQAEQAQAELQKERQDLAALKARQTRRGLELTFASDVLFDTASATLKPGANLQLNRLADYMRASPRTRILIEGYTDNRGSADYNEELSERRAQAVANALTTEGVDADRVQTVGRGKDFPIATNATPAGRQQNRRVDIVLSDASGKFAQGANEEPSMQ
ncbi:MAG TPA: OmpA family protein [Steroidobacteraceae bacterium]|jgi:outer membrane protein OmpA-like peptidoglycan-associated protein|nr:OmpA family protein [Steroidobacteraceae bacterium]